MPKITETCDIPTCGEPAPFTIQLDMEEGGLLLPRCRDHKGNRNPMRPYDPTERGTMLDWHEQNSTYGLDGEQFAEKRYRSKWRDGEKW